MKPGPRDRIDRLELFVQDPCGDADERGPEPRSTCRADCQGDPLAAEGQARRHHALHSLTRLERRPVQVDLSEHAVQVQVEAGDEVAGPESEARREDAGVAVGVRRDEVRRVPVDGTATEGGEQRMHALLLVETAQWLQPGERLRHA